MCAGCAHGDTVPCSPHEWRRHDCAAISTAAQCRVADTGRGGMLVGQWCSAIFTWPGRQAACVASPEIQRVGAPISLPGCYTTQKASLAINFVLLITYRYLGTSRIAIFACDTTCGIYLQAQDDLLLSILTGPSQAGPDLAAALKAHDPDTGLTALGMAVAGCSNKAVEYLLRACRSVRSQSFLLDNRKMPTIVRL